MDQTNTAILFPFFSKKKKKKKKKNPAQNRTADKQKIGLETLTIEIILS